MEQIVSESDIKMKPGCFLRRVMTRDLSGQVHSNARRDWEQAQGQEPWDSGSGNRYRHGGGPAGAVKWIRSLEEEGKAAKRTEQLHLSHEETGGGLEYQRQRARREGTDEGPRETRMERAGNQDSSDF